MVLPMQIAKILPISGRTYGNSARALCFGSHPCARSRTGSHRSLSLQRLG